MRRFVIIICATLLAVGFIAWPQSAALAAPGSADIGAANRKLQNMTNQMATAQKNYQASAAKLARARTSAANSRKELKSLNTRIETDRKALNAQADYLYRTGNASILAAVFSSQSLEEFFSKVNYLTFVSESNARVVNGLRADLNRHTVVQASLDSQLKTQEAQTASLRRQSEQATRELASTQSYVNTLSAQQQAALQAAAEAANARRDASSSSSSEASKSYTPPANVSGTGQTFSGIASWYSNGGGMTAAHKTLPFGTLVRVTYRGNSVVVRINDRGPYVNGRVIDLNRAAAAAIGLESAGIGRVTCEVVK